MSDSSVVIIQGTVGLYTVATRCHTCFAVTLKYTEDSSLTIGSPFLCSYSVNRFSRYLLLKAHNDPLKIWTATHTFSLLMLTQLTMAVNGLLLRQCVSKAIFKLTTYTSEFKFLLKQTIKYYILIF